MYHGKYSDLVTAALKVLLEARKDIGGRMYIIDDTHFNDIEEALKNLGEHV